jgi:hypothetical protein
MALQVCIFAAGAGLHCSLCLAVACWPLPLYAPCLQLLGAEAKVIEHQKYSYRYQLCFGVRSNINRINILNCDFEYIQSDRHSLLCISCHMLASCIAHPLVDIYWLPWVS